MAQPLTEIESAGDRELPAEITRAEWEQMRRWVWEMHTIITELNANVKPALEQIAKGGIFSALMGSRKS
jgi:hypothetical protein